MNYLAHAYLTPDNPYLLMGNLWGDLLRPMDYPALHGSIMDGVHWHKKIDAFTDQHKAVDAIVNILRPYQGKYTTVVADVLMDFILSKYWEQYHPQTIEAFCQRQYETVGSLLYLIPDRLHPRIHRMLDHQWLESCKNRERMAGALLMLSRRASFDNNIQESLRAYDQHDEMIDQLFNEFFEDARLHLSLRNAD